MCKILKLLVYALCGGVFFLCVSCSPAAGEAPTPTPTFAPEVTPTPIRHRWSGSGYACTSEALGIRVEFPPEWEKYFTFEEEEAEGLLQSGSSGRVLRLASEFILDDDPEYDTTFARIYWVPKGDAGLGTDGKALVTLWESDEGRYICEVHTIHQLDFDPDPGAGVPRPEYWGIRAVYEAVQNGIIDGRWEIEVLEPGS